MPEFSFQVLVSASHRGKLYSKDFSPVLTTLNINNIALFVLSSNDALLKVQENLVSTSISVSIGIC